MTETSAPYRTRDPQQLRERSDRARQLLRAKQIARLPESLWDENVKREPTDQQEAIWVLLRAIKRVRVWCESA